MLAFLSVVFLVQLWKGLEWPKPEKLALNLAQDYLTCQWGLAHW